MPVKSLMDLASAACLKNIKALESVGDFLPYEKVRHLLFRVDSAYQLRQIELNSPHIQGETGEIWLKIIERDFPLEYKSKGYKPQNADKWYRVWEKYKRDHDLALEESEKKLKNALAGLQQDKEKNTSKIVDHKYLPRPPRTGPKRNGPRDTAGSALLFGGGSRTKTNNGASVMRKVRREVKEIKNIHGSLSRPVIRGPSITRQIHKAPAAMVNDYKRAAQPVFRPTHPGADYDDDDLANPVTEHEKRATFISDSEEERDGYFDRDSLSPPRQMPAKRSTAAHTAATSLLKKKRPTSANVASDESRPGKIARTSSSAVKRGSGILSNKFKGSVSAVKKVVSSPPPVSNKRAEPEEPAKKPHYLPRTQTSPPLAAVAGPSSPPAEPLSPPPVPQIQRKKKPVDVFMRRKKRVV